MPFVPLAQRLASQVPLVLAGPILRHVAHDEVTVFVALREARTVYLTVYEGTGAARVPVLADLGHTVALGANLHVVAVTATGAAGTMLEPGTTYYYDLGFDGVPSLASAGILDLAATPNPLAYPGADLPSFALPPADLGQVRLVHGSCRKPHGESVDALPALDAMIDASGTDASRPEFALARPHQLFLTGDQIYADDVADMLLFLLVDAASALLGWQEPLSDSTAADLVPGARAPLTLRVGLTSAIPHPEVAKSHLLRFGEFATMYLFAWSPTLWPQILPTTNEIGTATPRRFLAEERERLESFIATLPTVRRALANVPTYMIFDDHEITDDWYMNRRWVGPKTTAEPTGGLLADPVGRRVVQNGLLAYAIFQAWGNTPGEFGPAGKPGTLLLQAMENWRGAKDRNDSTIADCVGLPAAPLPITDPFFQPSDGALRWHFRVAPAGAPYEVLVLDCRTVRRYPPGETTPAALLTTDAIQAQIGPPDDPGRPVTFVIAQTPVLGIPFIEDKQREARGSLLWERDAEAWGLNTDAFERLLAALAVRGRRIVVLSGDVHYSFAARMTYWAEHPYGQTEQQPPVATAIAQLTSSALKNETACSNTIDGLTTTMRLHAGGFNQFYLLNVAPRIERVGWWTPRTVDVVGIGPLSDPPGWTRIPAVVDIGAIPAGTQFGAPPDWRYRVEYISGTKPGGLPAFPLPTLATVPGNKAAAAAALAQVQNAYRVAATDDEGRDIVGRNNIGELRFAVAADGTPTAVIQRTWWRVSDDASSLPTTTLTVPLDPSQPPPPGPLQ